MKTLLPLLPVAALSLAACTPTTADQSTLLGAAGGAAVGYAVSGDGDKGKGALLGAAVGAVAGNLIGKANNPGECYYRDSYGNRYIAACP